MRKFNSIKKSRKKTKDIDEKIEYLDKECQKTGLQEVMRTGNIYQGSTKVPNQDYVNFNGLSHGGYALGLSGADIDKESYHLSLFILTQLYTLVKDKIYCQYSSKTSNTLLRYSFAPLHSHSPFSPISHL